VVSFRVTRALTIGAVLGLLDVAALDSDS